MLSWHCKTANNSWTVCSMNVNLKMQWCTTNLESLSCDTLAWCYISQELLCPYPDTPLTHGKKNESLGTSLVLTPLRSQITLVCILLSLKWKFQNVCSDLTAVSSWDIDSAIIQSFQTLGYDTTTWIQNEAFQVFDCERLDCCLSSLFLPSAVRKGKRVSLP